MRYEAILALKAGDLYAFLAILVIAVDRVADV
jgi:hypothetical protein